MPETTMEGARVGEETNTCKALTADSRESSEAYVME